ncbi:MAG: galactokinase [Pirellulaceae bacterium]
MDSLNPCLISSRVTAGWSEATRKLTEEAFAIFRDHFAARPEWISLAPGRVNLIGEHTDYNDGFVMPFAIDRHTVVVAAINRHRPADAWHCYSTNAAELARLELTKTPVEGEGWSRYLRGVCAGFLQLGFSIPPVDLVVHSNLPVGAGLSSSASLEVAVALLVQELVGSRLSRPELARLCQRAEHEFAGVPCGIMDQLCVACAEPGNFLQIDCRTQTIQNIPRQTPELTLLLVNSGVQHELARGEYARRREECRLAAEALGVASLRELDGETLQTRQHKLPEVLFRRARHVVSENLRVLMTAKAIELQDWSTVGCHMFASHASLRDDYEVSCPKLDLLVDHARGLVASGGVIGSRMTGGGFGGSTISLVRREHLAEVQDKITQSYAEKTGITAQAFEVFPAAGATILDVAKE